MPEVDDSPSSDQGSDGAGGVRFDVLVEVRLRPGIADPQGATVERALPTLGFVGVEQVRVGKAIRFTVLATDEPEARRLASSVSTGLLSNPVIEDAEILWCGPSTHEAVGSVPSGVGRMP